MTEAEGVNRRLFSLELAILVVPTVGFFVVYSCALTFLVLSMAGDLCAALVARRPPPSGLFWLTLELSGFWLLGAGMWRGVFLLAPAAARFLHGSSVEPKHLLIGCAWIAPALVALTIFTFGGGESRPWGVSGGAFSAALAFYGSGSALLVPLAHMWMGISTSSR
ncbi:MULTISPECIES: hypothetical protein [Methylosinus]|uniref:Uncharacterized protein n=1 Tax=Methylosinus trichosporium (strain ATCC 35070 / NCIMB 11131 / UNIQEM 75 / OB3b) TaxID=595536 RepID=A0A2D2D051_METT3|nr:MULTISPECIES: hypothetical protein [Methylosinus]ATQ68370.1 hypothetical protein CQW49_11125 [Methylosinus trichosporium OB3b]